jgi:MFS family permease
MNGLLIASLMVGYSVIYMDKSMIATAIIPISSQFHFDTGQTGLIMSLFFLGYSIMQIPCGWLADKFGAKRVLMASVLVIGAFSYLFGAMSGLLMFIVVRFCAGIGHGGYPPSCSKAIAEGFPREKRTFVQSLILSTSGIGGILAFTLGARLISSNWRTAYAVLGSLYLVAFIMIWIFVPGGNREQEEMSSLAEVKATDTAEPKPGFLRVIRNPNVLILFAAMLLLNVVLYGNMSWLPTYITQTFHLTVNQTGYILAFNCIFQTIAAIFSGTLLSKFFLHKEKQAIIGASLIVGALLVCFVLSKNLVVSIILLIVIGMCSMLAFTGIFTWPHKIMDARTIGSSIGVINTGGTLGGFLAPMVIGYLIKLAGGSFTPAFFFLAVVIIVAALAVLFVSIPKVK